MSLKGGAKLRKALTDLVKKSGQAHTLRVGFFAESKYPDGTNVAQVAYWNEYGTKRSLPRPFFRNAIQKGSPGWGVLLGEFSVMSGFNSRKSLRMLGEVIGGQVQRSIIEFSDPKNAESTIQRKGYDAPLRDTMQMARSVAYNIENGKLTYIPLKDEPARDS